MKNKKNAYFIQNLRGIRGAEDIGKEAQNVSFEKSNQNINESTANSGLLGQKTITKDLIDRRDLEYIDKYCIELKISNKDTAVNQFKERQFETNEIKLLSDEILENLETSDSLRKSLKLSKSEISNKEFSKKLEMDQLNKVTALKERLSSILPNVYKKEGEKFINNYLTNKHDNEYVEISDKNYKSDSRLKYKIYKNLFPGVSEDKTSFKDRLNKTLYSSKLKEFKKEFGKCKTEFSNETMRFDIYKSKENLLDTINKKYDTSLLNQEKDTLETKLSSLDSKSAENRLAIAEKQQSLEQKTDVFSNYYDKQLFYSDHKSPVIEGAIKNGQIFGDKDDVEHLSAILNMICEHSAVGQDVIYESINKGTKYFLSDLNGTKAGEYSGTCVSIDKHSNISKQISTMVHESKHALQDTGEHLGNNFSGVFLRGCFIERDAQAAACATSYDLKDILPDVYKNTMRKTPEMLKAYKEEIEKSGDIISAMNNSALKWDEDYGALYKESYAKDYMSSFINNSESSVLNPKEIIEKTNVKIFGMPYLDEKKATENSLNISKEVRDKLNDANERRVDNGLPIDASIDYFGHSTMVDTGKKNIFGLTDYEEIMHSGKVAFDVQSSDKNCYKYENHLTFSTKEETTLSEISELSPTLKAIYDKAKETGITFSETKGITKNNDLRPAIFDEKKNRIILNNSFSKAERVLSAVDLIMDKTQKDFSIENDMKSQIQHHSCNKAHKIASIITISHDIAKKLPESKDLIKYSNPEETKAYQKSNDAGYELAFVATLGNQDERRHVTNMLDGKIYKESEKAREFGKTPASKNVNLEDIMSSQDLSGFNKTNQEHIKNLLNQISTEAKPHLSYLSKINNDNSLDSMKEVSSYKTQDNAADLTSKTRNTQGH